MLKLIYTESGLYLEQVTTPLKVLVSQRATLALRSGQTLHVEAGKASFLLPTNAPGLADLETALRREHQSSTISPADDEYVEVSISGTWIAENAHAEEGTFITVLSDQAESSIYQLWQATQTQASFLRQSEERGQGGEFI